MLRLLRTSVVALIVGGTSLAMTTGRAEAQTYQIDCAILLCLSGGWPASVPCARARAEFIRRITPWPIEPPLQIWRCPMGAAYAVNPDLLPSVRIFDIKENMQPQLHPNSSFGGLSVEQEAAVVRYDGRTAQRLPEELLLQLIQGLSHGDLTADIDISGQEFNFVRSIRVFVVQANQKESGRDGDCNRSSNVRLGSYGTQGDYHWTRSSVGDLPVAHVGTERWGSHCPTIWHRSVFVEWRDYAGSYGYEQVDY